MGRYYNKINLKLPAVAGRDSVFNEKIVGLV